jgi:tRNA A-37 threonylcarbamoyl transferase component Bud32
VKAEVREPGRGVSVQGDVIVKLQDPVASRRERLRTQAAWDVSQRTRLFVVPRILSFDDARGEIVFERLALTGAQEILSDRNRSTDLVVAAARALAAIHRHLGVEEPNRDPGTRLVPLHGDFGLTNIHLSADGQLALIDWSNADWTGIDADRGVPEIDLAVFLISLFHRRLFGPCPLHQRQRLARHFLATYASESLYGIVPGTLRAVVRAVVPKFNELTRRRKGQLRALGYRHSMFELHFFIHHLPAERLLGQGERQVS